MFTYVRADKELVYFSTGNILLQENCIYSTVLSLKKYKETLNSLRIFGNYFQTNKRIYGMYCFGSTAMATKFPIYVHEGKKIVLPRPYANSKPGKCGHQILNDSSWFTTLIKDVEKKVFQCLACLFPNKDDGYDILMLLYNSKEIIPSCCRLCDTIFSQMIIIGNNINENDGYGIPLHKDEKDIISVLLHFGEVCSGGPTDYYDGLTVKSKGVKQ